MVELEVTPGWKQFERSVMHNKPENRGHVRVQTVDFSSTMFSAQKLKGLADETDAPPGSKTSVQSSIVPLSTIFVVL